MNGVKVEKVKADWIVVSYYGKNQFAATEAEARELHARLGEVLKGEHVCAMNVIMDGTCIVCGQKVWEP